MSTPLPPVLTTPSSTTASGGGAVTPPPASSYFTSFGLGYIIAIALGALVLLSTLLLTFYICCRRRNPGPNPNPSSGVVLPRIIFVAENDDEENSLESGVVGLDPAVINSYPRFPFSRDGGGDTACSICLCEYREGEMLRMLPDCRHLFHLSCVDAWLKLNASCPVCRSSPLPTPLSTPLSEIVPLSQYSDGRRRR